MRLFLHMPKCAGSSVRKLLEDMAPAELHLDYESYFGFPFPERSSKMIDALFNPIKAPANKIVYGHFYPMKYIGSGLADHDVLVTIIRDPVKRLLSHYKFWKSGYFPGHYLWRKMKDENWSFSQFSLCNEMKNFYSQYLYQVKLSDFSYIGVYEDIEKSVIEILKILNINNNLKLELPHYNKTDENERIGMDKNLEEEIRYFHAEDCLMYDYVIKKWHDALRQQPL
ncbi:sulfotransferase family 2 domain-containing protein [Rhizorhabdus phycosphaerae]|uniref:sulfotransferase family 2 domain-containing protein n=1 Tax=Rhizorhabdus phycosphaerae TaxID=2711156 RepID=UPI0013EA5E12|nr:sulfotransferase family 2 domain-containing protein [Rhizorhabdus phycosphaerae]